MSMEYVVIFLMMLLTVKHFIFDFLCQTPYMLEHKGTYGHPGGVMHAVTHACGTFIVFALVFLLWANNAFIGVVFGFVLGLLDGVLHYHIDYVKVHLSKNLTPADHQFWVYVGLDQALHMITYLILILVLF